MVRAAIRWLNTGWIEQVEAAHFHGGGKNLDAPAGQVTAWGREEELTRPDGSVSHGSVLIPTTVWLVQVGGTNILVDTGIVPTSELPAVDKYEGSLVRRITAEDELSRQLATYGLEPSDIDIVVQTHLHYDHLGSFELFPRAVILVNPLEVAWALCPQPYSLYYYKEFRHHVIGALDRIRLVGPYHQVAPGVEMVFTGGHSPGHSIVFADTADGRAVMVGDLVYHYRSLELDVPSGTNYNLAEAVRAMQEIKRADIILVNHDPLVAEMFPDGVGTGAGIAADVKEYMERIRTTGSFGVHEHGGAVLRRRGP